MGKGWGSRVGVEGLQEMNRLGTFLMPKGWPCGAIKNAVVP